MSKSKVGKCRRVGYGAQPWWKKRVRRWRVRDKMARASRRRNR